MALSRPPGLVPAVLGGFVGGGVGVWAAYLVFEQVSVGDLSDIGTGLLLLGGGLVVGPSVGVALGLVLARQKRAFATGLMTAPLMFAAIAAGATLAGTIDRATNEIVGAVLLLVLSLGLGVSAIWFARHITARE